MHELEIDFLRNREPEAAPAPAGGPPIPQPAVPVPYLVGGAIGLSLPLAVTGCGLWLGAQIEEARSDIQALDARLGQRQAGQQSRQQQRQQLEQIRAETQALASLFEQIEPVSELLQAIRDRIPANVQLQRIEQGGTTPLDTILTLSGFARSFETVNALQLTLQRSPLLQARATQIQSLERAPYPPQRLSEAAAVQVPSVVNYTLGTQASDRSAAQILETLERQGASGWAIRLRALQQQGMLEP